VVCVEYHNGGERKYVGGLLFLLVSWRLLVHVAMKLSGAPAKPSLNLGPSPDGNSIYLFWSAPDDNGRNISSYTVQLQSVDNGTTGPWLTAWSGVALSYTIPDLTANAA
jgi:hypothetical protein